MRQMSADDSALSEVDSRLNTPIFHVTHDWMPSLILGCDISAWLPGLLEPVPAPAMLLASWACFLGCSILNLGVHLGVWF